MVSMTGTSFQETRGLLEKMAQYRPMVYKIAKRFLSSTDDAEDITQRVYLKLTERGVSLYDSAQPIEPWLRKVALNEVRDFLRKKSHVVVIESLESLEERQSTDPQSCAIVKEESSRISRYLSPAQRDLLSYIEEGLSNKSIADVCSRPINTIKTQIHRTRKLVKKLLINDGYCLTA